MKKFQRAIGSNPVTFMWYSKGPKCKAPKPIRGQEGRRTAHTEKKSLFLSHVELSFFCHLKPLNLSVIRQVFGIIYRDNYYEKAIPLV